MEERSMKKPMRTMLIFLAILFGIVFLVKMFIKYEIHKYVKLHSIRIVTVSEMEVVSSPWIPSINAVGSTRTIKGVNVTTELAGMVRDIYFTPGAKVNKGDLLVQLDIDPDTAQLHSLQAQAALAKITYDRDKLQYKFGAVSKETLDTDEATYKSDAAQVVEQAANIAKKTIRAPFSGQLGIRQINIGQFINPGDNIVTIETIDPIYVDFYLPQQDLPKVSVGQTAGVTVDAFPNQAFSGKITTINSVVNDDSRNIEVELTIPNSKFQLMPGMFVNVNLVTGTPTSYLTVPEAALTFNSYGDTVYILQKTDQTKDNQPVWKAVQSFVTTGEKRGNQIAVLQGLKAGDHVVTSGQLKLKNGSLVTINNAIQPANSPTPQPPEE